MSSTYRVFRTWSIGSEPYEQQVGRLVRVIPGMDRMHDGLLLRFADGTEEVFSRSEVTEVREGRARC